VSRLRGRVIRTAGTRGELTLYELAWAMEIPCARCAGRPAGRHARRQLDLAVVQILLPRHARRRPCRARVPSPPGTTRPRQARNVT